MTADDGAAPGDGWAPGTVCRSGPTGKKCLKRLILGNPSTAGRQMKRVDVVRYGIVAALAAAAAGLVATALLDGWVWWIAAVAVGALAAVGIFDVTQRRHSVLRNYP